MKRILIGVAAAALVLARGAAAAEAAKETKETQGTQELRAEVKRLSEKVAALEARAAQGALQPATLTVNQSEASAIQQVSEKIELLEVKQKDAVTAGDIGGSFRIPGTEVSLRLYGFAELNWVHAFRADNSDSDYSTFAPYLPLDGSAQANVKNRDYFTARTSRIGVEAGTPTRYGVLGVKLEGDFNNEPRTGNAAVYGDARNVFTQQQTNSYGFRIRHLYGQFGGLLVGQTWSTFMDVDNFPETVDYNGPIGATFIRQPQIRFSYGTPGHGSFTVALENSSTYVLDSTGSAISSSASRMPDLVLRWDKSFPWGAASVRGMTQELRIDDGAGNKATKRGYGAAASVLLKTRGPDFLTAGVTGGEGLGRYLNYIEGAAFDAAEQTIRVERAIGVYAGYQLKPVDWVRVNFVYGMTRNFDNAYTDFAATNGLDAGRFGVNRYVQQAHVGPIFTPVKGVDLGLEGIWANRKTLVGEKGDDLRLDFSAKYYIN
jgi:hypothetical protein